MDFKLGKRKSFLALTNCNNAIHLLDRDFIVHAILSFDVVKPSDYRQVAQYTDVLALLFRCDFDSARVTLHIVIIIIAVDLTNKTWRLGLFQSPCFALYVLDYFDCN